VAGPTRDEAQGAEPGAISRLLLEIAQAPENDLAASWREPLEPGDVVGRYQIGREIGRGGFGAVYEAFDPELGRTVSGSWLASEETAVKQCGGWNRRSRYRPITGSCTSGSIRSQG
jgi:serine/threonine protein kinase